MSLRYPYGSRHPRSASTASKAVSSNTRSYMDTAAKALKLATHVASLINVEKKNIQFVDSGSQVLGPAVSLVRDLTQIGQGTDVMERTGDSVKCTDLTYHLQFRSDPTTLNVVQMVRLIIFKWNDDSTPTGLNILDGYQNGGIQNIYEMYNKSGIGKYIILHDEFIKLSASSACSNTHVLVKGNIKLGFHTKFNTTASSSGNVGRVFALMTSDEPNVAYPIVRGFFRVDYVDN